MACLGLWEPCKIQTYGSLYCKVQLVLYSFVISQPYKTIMKRYASQRTDGHASAAYWSHCSTYSSSGSLQICNWPEYRVLVRPFYICTTYKLLHRIRLKISMKWYFIQRDILNGAHLIFPWALPFQSTRLIQSVFKQSLCENAALRGFNTQ